MRFLLEHIARSWLLLLLLLGQRGFVHAQLSSPQPKFHNYTVEDGLPGSETYFVHQDKKGYIWICTDRGVSRFDGYKFQNFTIADGLTDNVVFRIYEDYKGRIWFVTYNSALCYYEKGKIHAYKYNDQIDKAQVRLKSISRKNIYVDKNDNMYFSLALNGLWIIDKHGKMRKHGTGKGIVIQKFDNQLMWIFDHHDLMKDSMEVDIFHSGKKIARYKLNTGISLASTKSGDYLLSDESLHLISSGEKVKNVVDAISLDYVKDALWIGTFKNGVQYIPDISKPWRTINYLGGLSVSSVMCDSEGGYWFTTLEKGIFYSPSLSIRTYTMDQGLIDNDIISVAGIKDNIYISFLKGRWQNLKYPAFENRKPLGKTNTILGNSNNRFYISANISYELVDGKLGDDLYNSWSKDYYNNGNSVIFGIQSVYRKFDDKKVEILYRHLDDPSSIRKNILQTVMMDINGDIWGGGLAGLIYIANRKMSIAGLDDPLFKIRVSDLQSHPEWKNIAATRGEGIYFFENKKVLRQIKEKDGLLSDLVNVIFIDEYGGIWVGTNKGVNHITKNAKGKIDIEAFTVFHGLCSNEISSIYVYNGMVYVGTKTGLSVIDTKTFSRNKRFSKFYITSFTAGNQKLNPHIYNVLSHKESYIKIEFRNTNYRTLKSGLFQYRFNKQSEWITASIPEISLINPLPGDYNLEIRYLNEDGIWSPPSKVCQFKINDAFYNRWYFFLLLSIVLAFVGWRLFRYRIKQLKQRHLLNNKINMLEQRALQTQMNPHFIFNALNSIQSFLVYEENEKAEKYLLKFAQLIRQTLNNSREPYITIKSEMETLEKYLDLERMRFKNKFKYKIINELDSNSLSLKIPTMLIQPFIENAVIHGFSTLDSGGEVTITLKYAENNQLLCIIEDNGVGRKRAMQQSSKTHVSFGTTITEERLKAFETRHGVQFRIETIDLEKPDGSTGTRVLINLPII